MKERWLSSTTKPKLTQMKSKEMESSKWPPFIPMEIRNRCVDSSSVWTPSPCGLLAGREGRFLKLTHSKDDKNICPFFLHSSEI